MSSLAFSVRFRQRQDGHEDVRPWTTCARLPVDATVNGSGPIRMCKVSLPTEEPDVWWLTLAESG